jgi:hypothetical protein
VSPFLIEQLAKVHDESRRQEMWWRRVRHTRGRIFLSLKRRFRRRVPTDLADTVAVLADPYELERWSAAAATADDLEAFRAEIARPHQPKYLGRRCGP